MTQLTPDFRDFLQLLNEHGVEYLVVGGYAVGYYGYPRATADIDVWIGTTVENSLRMVDVMVAFGFSADNVPAKIFREPDKVIRMGVPPVRIEILTGIDGVCFSDCWPRRHIVVWEHIDVPLIAMQDLIANKRASDRHKDRDDLEHLDQG